MHPLAKRIKVHALNYVQALRNESNPYNHNPFSREDRDNAWRLLERDFVELETYVPGPGAQKYVKHEPTFRIINTSNNTLENETFSTEVGAKKAAEQKALTNPDGSFLVLQSVGRVRTNPAVKPIIWE